MISHNAELFVALILGFGAASNIKNGDWLKTQNLTENKIKLMIKNKTKMIIDEKNNRIYFLVFLVMQ